MAFKFQNFREDVVSGSKQFTEFCDNVIIAKEYIDSRTTAI